MNVVIFGATSAIAKEYARIRATHGDSITLIGRDIQSLHEIERDLKIRGAEKTTVIGYDFEDIHNLSTLIRQVCEKGIDVALVSYGTLPDQEKNKNDFSYMLKNYTLNATSTISLLSLLSQQMRIKRQGTIAVITSVASDRGKKSNYYYGSAKAAVSVFLQGLQQELFQHNVHIVEIKPGFVDTPMTQDFKKGFLWAKPAQIAQGIDFAIQKKKNIVYLPFFWRYIMFMIKSIPESIFKKMNM